MSLLTATGISIRFGGLTALQDIGFALDPGDVLSIIGPNGAGKTTLFNIVSGLYTPSTGSIHLDGKDITNDSPERLARLGMSRTFQNLQIFFRMTALENVMTGRHRWERTWILGDLFAMPGTWRQNTESRRVSLALLERVGLSGQADTLAGNMSYGALKRLEIARALATEPRVLLLDEPAAGCNAVETAEIDELIQQIARSGVAVVLVEHDMRLVMKISSHILVLAQGRTLAEGRPEFIRSHPEVIAAYLGAAAAGAGRA
ncbi:ABC transporter ATP-binding protein [Bradyrhizobium sp. STM 3566]|uniref:ABC transporter ATP-binding protein n=1 Tax=Bradyrhizobium sp. STM 3566 TaxID=578928 RepID=UPI00388DAC9D